MHIAGSLRHVAGKLQAEGCTAHDDGGGFAVGRDMSLGSDVNVSECRARKEGRNPWLFTSNLFATLR